MSGIAFIDIEVSQDSNRILDIGGVKDSGAVFHNASITEFSSFIRGVDFICGHNILNHDIKYLGKAIEENRILFDQIIDTLYLSPLLFPAKPYHALVKDDKLESD